MNAFVLQAFVDELEKISGPRWDVFKQLLKTPVSKVPAQLRQMKGGRPITDAESEAVGKQIGKMYREREAAGDIKVVKNIFSKPKD